LYRLQAGKEVFLKSIFETEAEVTFAAFSRHIRTITAESNSNFGEGNWQLCFRINGEIMNISSAEVSRTIIIFHGKCDNIEYEIAQHYSSLSYTAFVIPTPNAGHKAPVVRLVPKD
jgi:hypothetical protein